MRAISQPSMLLCTQSPSKLIHRFASHRMCEYAIIRIAWTGVCADASHARKCAHSHRMCERDEILRIYCCCILLAWWRHQIESFSALLALCVGNSPVPDEFPSQRPVTRSFEVFFDLCLNKRLSKQSWGWWCETPPHPLRHHSNETLIPASFLLKQPHFAWLTKLLKKFTKEILSWLAQFCYRDKLVLFHSQNVLSYRYCCNRATDAVISRNQSRYENKRDSMT